MWLQLVGALDERGVNLNAPSTLRLSSTDLSRPLLTMRPVNTARTARTWEGQ